jgi:hypothetical protein
MKRQCFCGGHDVTGSDIAEHHLGWLVVHGLYHCFTVPSAWKPSRRKAT